MIMISFCNAFWPYHGGISGGIGGSSSLGVKSMIDLLVYPRAHLALKKLKPGLETLNNFDKIL